MTITIRFLVIFLLCCACSFPATYYMSPTGSDGNAGTSAGVPWASPNHALNCGDTIQAAAGTYPALTAFGTVTCAAGNNVAWLICSVFDTCKISITSGGQFSAGIIVGKSYWGVQGWEVSVYSGGWACFMAYPATSSTNIHHVVFANNVANGCGLSGFNAGDNGSAGYDYLVFVGNIAYNSVQGSAFCTSAFNTIFPVAADSNPGTHIYIGGNFAFGNVDPNPCNGGTPTDGQGFFFDVTQPYSQQMVIDNNIAVFNGGNGFKSFDNSTGNPNARIYFRQNTSYGNETGSVNGAVCSEIGFQSSLSSLAYGNLAMTSGSTACFGSTSLYAMGVSSPDSTNHLYGNFVYSASGNNASGTGSGFSYGPNNVTGVNPNLANPVNPPAPSCSGFSSVTACMATVAANFIPTNAAAAGYGYQKPSSVQSYDPLFPQWLCNVNLPTGLITMACASISSYRSGGGSH